MAASRPECEHCPDHGEQRADIKHISDELIDIKSNQTATLEFIRQDLRSMQEEITANRDNLHRRISERIPIRHAITGITIMVGVVTSIITFFAYSSGRIDDKLENLQKNVAVMAAVNEERKYQLTFQRELLNVLVESLQEKLGNVQEDNHDHDYDTRFGKPGD